ncbi:MAG: hypothetical protein H3C48_12265 [Chitinophagaceae bacterium]|nr:hypothetical protein [Chitinophagaceae bacterium]
MKLLNFIVILISFFTIISCSKKDTITPEEGKQSIYIAGYEIIEGRHSATVWKDGVATHLNDGIDDYGDAMSVFVRDKDVYVAGYTRPKTGSKSTATLWVNNTPRPLTFSGDYSIANAVYVSGNDVYVAGYEVSGKTSTSIIWKNGVREALDADGYPTALYDIFVSGGDVYAAGTGTDNTTKMNFAAYWKNGVFTKLTTGETNTYANSIFVKDNNVYIAGSDYIRGNVGHLAPMLWINGVANRLPAGSNIIAKAMGVFVDGNDVYVVGNQVPPGEPPMAMMWKNNKEFSRDDQVNSAVANAVYVSGGEVFATGIITPEANSGKVRATFWKNGLNRREEVSLNLSSGYDIFVTNGKN